MEKDSDQSSLLRDRCSDVSDEDLPRLIQDNARTRERAIIDWVVRGLAVFSLPLGLMCLTLYIRLAQCGPRACEPNADYLFPSKPRSPDYVCNQRNLTGQRW